MWSTMLHMCHTGDAYAKRVQTELHDTKVQRTRGAGGMARRLPNSSQVSKRNQCHDNALRAAHARELRSTLAEESSARIHQLLEPVLRSLHRKLQIHIRATSLTRGTAGMQTRNKGGPASIHPAMDDTQEFSGRHRGRKCDRRVQARPSGR